jgi:hypothetical protein
MFAYALIFAVMEASADRIHSALITYTVLFTLSSRPKVPELAEGLGSPYTVLITDTELIAIAHTPWFGRLTNRFSA